MKLSILSALFIAANALPLTKREDAIDDATILQFALTLEHLENDFYSMGVDKFSQQDFCKAGFPKQYYDNLKMIASDEAVHVKDLSDSLTTAGAKPVQACQYDFGVTDVKSFVTVASVLEGVGSGAYLGAAPAIQNKDYLKVAGAILSTESLHTGIQRYALKEIASSNPYMTPLTPNSAYTLAAQFIKNCPSSNGALPFKAFPMLKAEEPGNNGNCFKFMADNLPSGELYVTFVNGLQVVSQISAQNQGAVTACAPKSLNGQTYAFITSAKASDALDEKTILAGPAVLELPFSD